MTTTEAGNRTTTPTHYVMRKLPHVALLFWVLKTVAVTLGETAGDLFGITFKLGYVATAAAFAVFFAIVVTLQVRARRFHAALFWSVILGTSLVGTEISDFLDRGPGSGSEANGVGYGWGMLILTAGLGLVFVIWRTTGQTYDVENIATRKGEILYWTAILLSNTLGTASGDWLSDDTGLGFRNAFLVIAAIMAGILALHYLTRINGVVLFWIAFVLTRPLGAAGGDSLTKPTSEGGLGWGTAGGSAALLGLLVLLVLIQAAHVRRSPLGFVPFPRHRTTGELQTPNGGVVLAHGRRFEHLVPGVPHQHEELRRAG
ncbi:MAG TPA: hypothetical protein VGJ14_07855 [Sporichthyaceae bacterium]|jgi:uncharacterized membrane-anchored protein